MAPAGNIRRKDTAKSRPKSSKSKASSDKLAIAHTCQYPECRRSTISADAFCKSHQNLSKSKSGPNLTRSTSFHGSSEQWESVSGQDDTLEQSTAIDKGTDVTDQEITEYLHAHVCGDSSLHRKAATILQNELAITRERAKVLSDSVIAEYKKQQAVEFVVSELASSRAQHLTGASLRAHFSLRKTTAFEFLNEGVITGIQRALEAFRKNHESDRYHATTSAGEDDSEKSDDDHDEQFTPQSSPSAMSPIIGAINEKPSEFETFLHHDIKESAGHQASHKAVEYTSTVSSPCTSQSSASSLSPVLDGASPSLKSVSIPQLHLRTYANGAHRAYSG